MKFDDMVPVRSMLDHFHDQHVEAPREVGQAFVALVGDAAKISHAVSAYALDRESEGPQGRRATWECLALAGDSLVSVSASRAGGDWYTGSVDGAGSRIKPNVCGRLIPLREISECRILELRSYDAEEWQVRWQLQLRDGDTLTIPWPRRKGGQDDHEAFALEVADRIR